jgi:hypothetical protein
VPRGRLPAFFNPETTDVKLHRCRALPAASLLVLLVAPLAACSKEDQTQIDRKLDELGKEAQEKLEEAKPQIQKGVRDAQEAVGKGVEAAGELIEKGGEELQKGARDTSDSSLPDTLSSDASGHP